MNFRVGMKVVSIGGGGDPRSMAPAGSRMPKVNMVYTIAEIRSSIRWPDESVLVLAECDYSHRAIRFRPAVSPKSEISFTQGAPLDSEQWDNRRLPARVKEIGASA